MNVSYFYPTNIFNTKTELSEKRDKTAALLEPRTKTQFVKYQYHTNATHILAGQSNKHSDGVLIFTNSPIYSVLLAFLKDQEMKVKKTT